MSKTITTATEYACYDDAVLLGAYPAILESYRSGSTASVADSYGTMMVSATGSQALSIPAGATVQVYPQSGASVALTQTVTKLTPTGSNQALSWGALAGAPVTLPGVLNSGSLTISAVNSSMVVQAATAFTAQIVWWL